MDLDSLANIGEFVGGMGVILSLIYLAVQVRGNTRSQRNDIEARALERLGSMQREMSSNPDLNKVHMRGLIDVKSLKPAERVQFTWWLTEFFSAMEFLYVQHEQGNVSEAIWQRWVETYKWWMTFPGVREWWKGKPTPFSSKFTAFTENCLEQGFKPEKPGAWEAYLAGDSIPAQD